MKKIGILSGIVILLLIIFIWSYLRPHKVDKAFSGVIYSLDSGFEKQTGILLRGNVHKRLFSPNVLVGHMTLDNDLTYDIKLKADLGGKYFEILTSDEENYGTLHSIGTVMMPRALDRIWIQLDDINERYHFAEGYASGPAGNMEEANEVARTILGGA